MNDKLVGSCVVGMFSAALMSCSLLIHTNERQCKNDDDCKASMLGDVCVDQVCIAKTECTGNECSVSNGAAREGPCMNDDECTSPDAPRCFKASCVSRDVALQWSCSSDDQTVKSPTIRYGFHVVDFLSRQPPKNLVVKACRSNDVDCVEPVGMFDDPDKTGHAQFDLPNGFFGFFEVKSDALPTVLYVTKPITRNTLNRDLPVLTMDTVGLLLGLIDYKADITKGFVLIEALDCADTPGGGVQFRMGDKTADFYVVDQTPSRDAKLTVYDPSNNTADGGFVNVDPALLTFSARLGVDGLELGSFNARIRPNTVTFLDMYF